MRKIKVVTNESFEKYIEYLSKRSKYEALGRRYEGRWDSLDLDDITADVNAPSEAEIDSAVRELDLFDDIAVKSGADDVEVGSDGKLRLLDLDEPAPSRSNKSTRRDARFAGLDLDEKPNNRNGKRSSNQDDDKIRELDLDEKGAENTNKKSNVGALGALDYDDDIDTSGVAASIDDVYTALASDNPKTVKSMVKRYACDITDEKRIKDVMLIHATNLNLECLRVMCGDMKIALTAKEKSLGFIDRAEIKNALERFKIIAGKLTGANNTYGLIPNAIVSCTSENQQQCINVVDFLKIWCDLPVIPLYFRGAIIRHCYQLADYLLEEIGNTIPVDILTGGKGLINRLKQLDDVPSALLLKIAKSIAANNKITFMVLGDFIITCVRNKNKRAANMVLKSVSDTKNEMIMDYIEDSDTVVYQALSKSK
jgi:hypothetical protein